MAARSARGRLGSPGFLPDNPWGRRHDEDAARPCHGLGVLLNAKNALNSVAFSSGVFTCMLNTVCDI